MVKMKRIALRDCSLEVKSIVVPLLLKICSGLNRRLLKMVLLLMNGCLNCISFSIICSIFWLNYNRAYCLRGWSRVLPLLNLIIVLLLVVIFGVIENNLGKGGVGSHLVRLRHDWRHTSLFLFKV